MRIEIGQDATGRWAWMIHGWGGTVVASDDNYMSAALAMEDALNQLEMKERSERRRAEAERRGE